MIAKTPSQKNIRKAIATRKQRGDYKAKKATGVIDGNKAYALQEFCDAIGTTRNGVIKMRREGLKAREVNNRLWIDGAEYLRFIREDIPVAELEKRAVAEA